MNKLTLFVSSLFLLLTISFKLFAEPIKLEFMHDKPVIDGTLSEPLWQQATPINVNIEVSPENNVQSDILTRAYVYENGETLYIGIDAFDAEPDKIRATYKKRDNINADDRVIVTIDTFNGLRRAFRFAMNPFGVQSDEIFNENGGSNKSWNALWQGAGKVHAQGYSLEFEIPFKSLRFPVSDQGQIWRIEVERMIPRSATTHLASAPKERGNDCFLCQVPEYEGVCNVETGTDVLIVPTLLAGRSDTRENEQLVKGEMDSEFGLDLKWGITPDNVLNLTVNPDFSQVESDASQITVNNTFSPSFAEKRPFFLEGNSFFKTAKSGLVHTRNIVAPEYGAKLTGQTGQHNYGLLATKDELTSFILPNLTGSEALTLTSEDEQSLSSNNFIARYNYNFAGLSNMGVLMTNKSAQNYNNDLMAIDGNYQPTTAHKLSYEVAYSDTKNTDYLQQNYNLKPEQSGGGINVQYDYRQPDYYLGAKFVSYDKDFRADLSRHGRVGHNYKRLGGGYDWFGDKNNSWTKIGVYADVDQTYENGGVKLRQEVEAHYFIKGPMQLWWKHGFKDRTTYWEGNYYDELWTDYWLAFDPIDEVRVRWLFTEGKRVDFSNNRLADYKQITYGADWRAFSHFTGTFKVILQDMSVEQGMIYQVDQLDLRATWQFDLAHSLKVVFKYTHVERNQSLYIDEVEEKRSDFASQLVYSWAPTPFTVVHAGYSNASFNDEYVDEVTTNNQNLFLKLSYGFQL